MSLLGLLSPFEERITIKTRFLSPRKESHPCYKHWNKTTHCPLHHSHFRLFVIAEINCTDDIDNTVSMALPYIQSIDTQRCVYKRLKAGITMFRIRTLSGKCIQPLPSHTHTPHTAESCCYVLVSVSLSCLVVGLGTTVKVNTGFKIFVKKFWTTFHII